MITYTGEFVGGPYDGDSITHWGGRVVIAMRLPCPQEVVCQLFGTYRWNADRRAFLWEGWRETEPVQEV